jgi:hypothetical protein
VYGVDDLRGIDALEIRAGDAEVGVSELALDDRQRYSFSGELDCVGMAELMRCEPTPDTGQVSQAAQLGAGACVRPALPWVGPATTHRNGPTGRSSLTRRQGSSCC